MALVYTILLQTFVLVLLIGSLFAIGIGACLTIRPSAVTHLFERMNRWISTRHILRSMEVQRDIDLTVFKWRRPIAVALILFSVFGLFGLFRYEMSLIVSVFVDKSPGMGTLIIFDTVKWVLVIGNICGIFVGVLLFQFPHILAQLNSVMSRWVSTRQSARGMDDMHMTIDNWVMAYPKIAGSIIVVLGFSGTLGLILFMLGQYWG